MNTNALPPDDDLDRMLSAYFKQQMPEQWPACRATSMAEPSSLRPATPAGQPARSSLTLAASVAALLGLGLYLSSDPRQPNADPIKPNNLDKGTAKPNGLLEKHLKAPPAKP